MTDPSGTILKMIIPAGQANAGTYLVTWNGHGDALALWLVNADGTLTLADTFAYSSWGPRRLPKASTTNGLRGAVG